MSNTFNPAPAHALQPPPATRDRIGQVVRTPFPAAWIIHDNLVLGLERGDGLDLNMIVAKPTISALRIGLVQLYSVGDGAEELPHVSVHIEMTTCLNVVAFRQRQEILKIRNQRSYRIEGIALGSR